MPRNLTAAELERIFRYRHLQTEAVRAAAACKSAETRDAYLIIASAWGKMIADIENIAEHDDPDDARDFDFMPPPERQRTGKALRK